MARIRTIKPEFPQSESMGRVSRDARLLFVNLFTLADDAGRARGNSRMLASLLYPYDDDAPSLIDGWLAELEREDCVRLYQIDGNTYLQITKWLEHQKIDKPSKSKIPEFDEASRIVSKPRERSSGDLDLDQRTKEGTKDQEGTGTARASDEAPPSLALTTIDRDDCDEAIGLWNAMAQSSGLACVRNFTDKRRRSLRLRLRECGGLDGWRTALQRVSASPFLLGSNKSGWRADFDFLMQQSSFTKLMEGGYDRSTSGRTDTPVNPIDAGLALALDRR